MRKFLALLLYRVSLPCLFIAAFPAWVIKMLRRGGLHTPLGERIAIYGTDTETEPCGAIHIHAVSVGETIIALKLIREWLSQNPQQSFVLATGTAYTIRDFLGFAFGHVGIDWQEYVKFDPHFLRPTEVDELIGDAGKAERVLGWKAKVLPPELARIMVDADLARLDGAREGQF